MSNLKRTIVLSIEIDKAKHTYTIHFPRVKDYIQVEVRKAELATSKRGDELAHMTQYLNMIRQGTVSSIHALDLIDMVAWFEVCIPDLVENLVGDLSSISDLDIFDARPLLKVYNSDFKPWKDSWEKVLHDITQETLDEDENKNSKEEGK